MHHDTKAILMAINKDLFLIYRSAKVLFLGNGYFCKIKTSHIAIDADGAHNAYGPAQSDGDADGSGLDSLTAACYPPGADDPLGQEDWTDILVPDPENPNRPYLKDDGFYISKTTLCDEAKGDRDPDKFLDANNVSYIVIPQFWVDRLGIKLGDLCVLTHSKVNKPVVAIVGDFCPFIEELGEMSIKTALNLGASEATPREGVTIPRGIILARFIMNSMPADLWPLTDDKLQAMLPTLAATCKFDPMDQNSYMNGLVKVDTDGG